MISYQIGEFVIATANQLPPGARWQFPGAKSGSRSRHWLLGTANSCGEGSSQPTSCLRSRYGPHEQTLSRTYATPNKTSTKSVHCS